MKYLLLLCFMLLALAGNAQSPDKIVLSYATGGMSSSRPGIYSRGEKIEIDRLQSGDYKITRYLSIKHSIAKDSSTFVKDTASLKTSGYHSIPKRLIDSLLFQLAITKDNFTFNFIRPWLKQPSKKRLLQMAKDRDVLFRLQDYDDKIDKELVAKFRSFDKLSSYIKTIKPNPKWYTATIDAWDNLRILVINKRDTALYHCDFLHALGQPVQKIITGNGLGPQIVNLEVNICLQAILPRKTLIAKCVSINSLTGEYLAWRLNQHE
jgi:hypothetical protein